MGWIYHDTVRGFGDFAFVFSETSNSKGRQEIVTLRVVKALDITFSQVILC